MNSKRNRYDAVVIGSGPNGLAAAITLARQKKSVLLVEAAATVGGGMRSAELTLPGFTHDVCSTIHALGVSSPFFKTVPLARHGLEWLYPLAPLAHPLDDGTAVLLERSVEATAAQLGRDAAAYRWLMEPLCRKWDALSEDLLGPMRLPKHPIGMARFGLLGLQPADRFARHAFRGERAQALFGGLAAHAILPLEKTPTAAFGLILGVTAHAGGWPVAQGGSQKAADALAAELQDLGGEIITGVTVNLLSDLPESAAFFFDTSPRRMCAIAGDRLPKRFKNQLDRYRYGPGVFKIDWALDGPIPWSAQEAARAGTVHLGGTLEEIARTERAVWAGIHPEKPFVLLAQTSLFDPSRAPAGKQTAWAYCHVPNGSTSDMTEQIESQVERFAPGFRERILAKSVSSSIDMERYNPNYIGGDINGGSATLFQLFARPTLRWNPYSTPARGIYLCSASTPPGGGVHGMCGFNAATAALREI